MQLKLATNTTGETNYITTTMWSRLFNCRECRHGAAAVNLMRNNGLPACHCA